MFKCCRKPVRTDFNGPLANMLEVTRVLLEEITGLEIPQETFRGKIEVGEGALYQSRDGGTARTIRLEDWDLAKKRIYDGNEFMRLVPPRPGVVEILWQLYDAGFEMHIVTSCWGLKLPRVYEWVRHHDLPVSKFNIQTEAKDKFHHYSWPGVVVDDSLVHLERILEIPNVTPILMIDPITRKWMPQEESLAHPNLNIMGGWDEVREYLCA